MDIKTATTTIVTIELTIEEANSALLDPSELQAALAVKLHSDVFESRRNNKKKPRGNAGPKGRGSAARGSAQVSTMTTCPQCGREVKAKGLGIHIARAHKTTGAPAAGD